MADLISLADLKIDLGIDAADTSADSFLQRHITAASEAVEKIIGYPLERATRTYTRRLDQIQRARAISIPFLPLHDVTKITVDGNVWHEPGAATPIELGRGYGFTAWGTIQAPYGRAWFGEVAIEFESGYYLADDAGPPSVTRDLPAAFERAVSEIIRPLYHGRDRDPTIKSESVPGVWAATFGEPGGAGGSVQVPAAAWSILSPYRLVRVA